MKMRSEKGGLSTVYQGVFAGEKAAFKTVAITGRGASVDVACLISERQKLEDLARLAGGSAHIRERGFLPVFLASTNKQQPAILVEGEGDEETKKPIVVLVTPWVSSGDDSGKYEFIEIMAAITRYNFRKISQKLTAPLSAAAAAQAKEEVLIGIRAMCLFIHAHITTSNALLYALDNMASDVFLKWTALLDRSCFLSCCPWPSTSPPPTPTLSRPLPWDGDDRSRQRTARRRATKGRRVLGPRKSTH